MNTYLSIVTTYLMLASGTPCQLPTAAELLDKYAETQDKLRSSFISKLEIDSKFEAFAKARPNIKPGKIYRKHFKIEMRSDGKRSYVYIKMWGDRPGTIAVSEAKAQHSYNLRDGRIRYHYIIHPHLIDDLGNLRLYHDRSKFAWQHTRGRALRGYFPGVHERIDTELRQARTLSVESRRDSTNGSQLYVINGKAGGSEFQIWIDPEHGHNIAKAIVKRAWASWNRPEDHSKRPPKGYAIMWMNNVRFKQIDGLWVPVASNYRREHRYVTGEYEKSHSRITITDYIVNPDHGELDSFGRSFIRNGAKIKSYVDRNNGIHSARDPEYLWQRDAEIVADRNGCLVRYEPEKKLFPAVKRIPRLRYLHLKSMERKVEGKSILLCFCDMAQPASRQCVMALQKQIRNLDGIVVALVDCLRGTAARNRSRIRLDRSSFPTGVIDRNADKLLRAWNVERLPHLVLTDKDHLVIAEGFGVDALNDKI